VDKFALMGAFIAYREHWSTTNYWRLLNMTEEEYNAHEDRESEKYDIDKDRELLEA
jgi:hypothetical protein